MPNVIWVRVEKPVLDLVGILTASFSLTAICLLVALAFGSLFGAWLLRRNRDRQAPGLPSLQLRTQPHP